MKNGDMPAIPFEEVRSRIHGSPDKWVNHKGLTKRETIAIHMMTSLIPIYWDMVDDYDDAESLVKCMSDSAVEHADALLAALERTGQ